MKTGTTTGIAVSLATITLLGCTSTPPAGSPAWRHEPLIVFLVRHAEKTDASEDPALTAAGRERAEVLARILRSARIEHVHSSDFTRTRQTGAPTAADCGVQVELYDPGDLPALVEKLHGAGGRHLVVGHSNTTPAVVELLGGEPGSDIDEESEFDRLYVVTIGKRDTVSSVTLRYEAAHDRAQK